MTHEELQSQLIQAMDAVAQDNYDEAQRLSEQILASLSSTGNVQQVSTELATVQATATRILGGVSIRHGDYPQALEHFNASMRISQHIADQEGIAKTLSNIGNVHNNLNDYPKALEYMIQALGMAEELGNLSLVAILLSNIGSVHNQRSDYPKALEYHGKALGIAEELGDQRVVENNISNIGSVHASLSDYPKALEHYGRALGIAEALGNKRLVANNLTSIGAVYGNLSDYPRALDYYSQALAIAEALGNKRLVAINLGNIGNAYRSLSDYPKALECHGKALGIDEALGNKRGVAVHVGNIGIVHLDLSDYPTALDYFGKALSIAEELGDKGAVAIQLGNIGIVYFDLSDYRKALEYFVKSLGIAEVFGNKNLVANNLGNIGNVHRELADYAKALEGYNRALQMQDELGHRKEAIDTRASLGTLYALSTNPNRDDAKAESYLLEAIAQSQELGTKHYNAHKTLAELYERQGRLAESIDHLKTYHRLKDEVQSEEVRKSTVQMEQRRQIAEREKEIAIAKAAADAQMSATTTLLYKVLPESVATRMIGGEEEIADYFPQVSILFADIVGFTPIASQMQARDVMSLLNYIFAEFDRIMQKHGCQKIKTMGDGYMAVSGAPIPCHDHAERLANAALDLLNDIELPESLRSSLPKGSVFQLRIGLHCGPAFAGIVGTNGFVYDVYSDAVNQASRMESHGEPGRIQCSEDFAKHLSTRSSEYRFIDRGELDIKGKGRMQTYFLETK